MPIRNPNTSGATGWCLEVHDLAASKLVAGREKDLDFVRVLFAHDMVRSATLAKRIAALPLTPEGLTLIQERLRRIEPRENRIRPGDGS